MQVEELREQMLAGEPRIAPIDVTTIRTQGRRLRWRRRAATGAAALAVTGLVTGGAVMVAGGVGGVDRAVSPAGTDREVTGITAYEQRILDELPKAFAVDGTVVVPGTVDPSDREMNRFFSDDQVDGRVRPLGVHLYTGLGYLAGESYPGFMHGNLPEGSQVRADNGPSYLGCVEWQVGDPCGVAVLVKPADEFAHGYGLGTDTFLEPGAEMEVFIDGTYDGGVYRDRVVGGFDGTSAVTVLLTLADGSEVKANIDSGAISEGDTLFWAAVPEPLASVTAYDAEGEVVTSHEIRPCSDPVDCEVR